VASAVTADTLPLVVDEHIHMPTMKAAYSNEKTSLLKPVVSEAET